MATTQLIIRPLDQVLARYADAMSGLTPAQTHKVMARAMNYEGRKAFTQVKRALHVQTSISRGDITKGTRFKQASVASGNALEVIIEGRGSEIPLKRFGARQFTYGVRAKVWGRMQQYPGQFMGPRPGVIASKLHGRTFVRSSKARLPIEQTFGPSIPKEIVKDQSAAAFYASTDAILNRVGKEIAAVLRGF